MSPTESALRPVTAENEDEMKFALSTLVSSLNGIEKTLGTMPEGPQREMLACWHGLAEQAVGVLFRPEPVEAKPAHHPNGTANGNGRGLSAAQLAALSKGRNSRKKLRCSCGRVMHAGPMGMHKKFCASAKKAAKKEK